MNSSSPERFRSSALRAALSSETPLTATTPGSSLEVWRPAPGILVDRCVGRATLLFAQFLMEQMDVALAEGHETRVFADWEGLQSYESQARIELTRWTALHKHEIRGIHVLLRSRIIAMGVAVGNLATGGITRTYTSRAAWEALVLESLQER